MKTIDVLREIRDTHSARVLYFNPLAKPVSEGLEIVAELTEADDPRFDPELAEYERPRLLVDMQTANVVVTVYDAVKPETQVKIDRLLLSKNGFIQTVDICWKAVS